MPGKGWFNLPQLPRPDYVALQALRDYLGGATQLEVVCVGIRALAKLVNEGRLDVARDLLAEFRKTAPSEQPALVPPHDPTRV